jgi:hypothetical protein
MEQGMNEHDLKELKSLGAELGAAKAEVERLREVLGTCEAWFAKHSPTAPLIGGFGDAEHPMITFIASALSQQAEHACSNCEGVQPESCMFAEPAEPAPAQDKREAFKRALHNQKVFKLSSATIDAAEWAWFARPAQTEQQPEQSGLSGHVCGGDAEHNTVNVALTNPAPWGELRIGTHVTLSAQRGDA